MTTTEQQVSGVTYNVKVEMENIPRNTLEYFASTYTSLENSKVYAMTERKLIEALENAGSMNRAWQVYKETEKSITDAYNMFEYYRQDPFAEKTKVEFSQVLGAIDETHPFGKAVFMLLLELGSIETGDSVFYANRKAA